MPTPMQQGEIWEVVTEGTQEGQQVLNVWHFRADTAVDDAETRMLRAILECFLTNIIPVAASTFQMTRVHGKRLFPTIGPIVEVFPEPGAVVQGEAIGDATPSFVSACAIIRSTRGTRKGMGRKFIMAVPESATQGSFFPPANAYWLALLAFAACVAEKFIHTNDIPGSNQVSLGVFSRKDGVTVNPDKSRTYHAAGFAHATLFKPINRVSHNVSRTVRRGS